jgi:hypothetical protein
LPIGIDCEDGIALIHAKEAGIGCWMAMLVAMFQALDVRKESTIRIKLPKSRGNDLLDLLEVFLSYKREGTKILKLCLTIGISAIKDIGLSKHTLQDANKVYEQVCKALGLDWRSKPSAEVDTEVLIACLVRGYFHKVYYRYGRDFDY